MTSNFLNQPGANVYGIGVGSRPENVEVPHLDVRAPTTSDVNWPVGKGWVDTVNNAAYVLTSFTSLNGQVTANWAGTAGGSVLLNTLSGDSGTAMPSSGNIKLAGTSQQITTAASGSTVTFSVPNTFSFGSNSGVNSGTLLAGSGGLTLTSANGNNTINAGTGVTAIATDAASSVVSLGTGAGFKAVTIGSSNTTSSLNLNCGTGGCNVGVTANAHATTVGSTTGASATTVQSGTGGTAINSTSTGAVTINSGPSISSAGIYINTVQPLFSVYLTGVASNVTGNGTQYTILFSGVLANQGSYYASGTGLFTAPVTGNYQFNTTVGVGSITVATQGYIRFVDNSGFLYEVAAFNPMNTVAMGNRATFGGSVLLHLNAGQTLGVTITTTGEGSNSNSVFGGTGSPFVTTFGGMLIS
jgi:hypothetical protein